ncbi:MAG: hypothetical protein ABFQ53_03515 [Patescibacteria group bacterium]
MQFTEPLLQVQVLQSSPAGKDAPLGCICPSRSQHNELGDITQSQFPPSQVHVWSHSAERVSPL